MTIRDNTRKAGKIPDEERICRQFAVAAEQQAVSAELQTHNHVQVASQPSKRT